MSKNPAVSRRGVIAAGLGGVATVIAGRLGAGPPESVPCAGATPTQIEGPFHPTRPRADQDMDLTRVKGRATPAAGEVVYVRGRVLDQDCRPVADAVVEIWQANTWGRYDHERDTDNPKPLDPNFQSWGEVLTGADGRYGFKTIQPGSYPADDRGWIRPPHIHFKVSRRGHHEFITQMYFEGEPLNEPDGIRRALSPEERQRVTIAFQSGSAELEPGTRLGIFDITLRRVT